MGSLHWLQTRNILLKLLNQEGLEQPTAGRSEVDSPVSILLPLHQVAYKHRSAGTLPWLPLQAERTPKSDLICWTSPPRKALSLLRKLQWSGSWLSFKSSICVLKTEVGFASWHAHLVTNLLTKRHTAGVNSNISQCKKMMLVPVAGRDGKLRPEESMEVGEMWLHCSQDNGVIEQYPGGPPQFWITDIKIGKTTNDHLDEPSTPYRSMQHLSFS